MHNLVYIFFVENMNVMKLQRLIYRACSCSFSASNLEDNHMKDKED
jgi:hypothetical protein